MKETVGFIGLGLMGKPMSRNLMKAGYRLVVHSRSRGPVDELAGEGATAAWSPAEVAASADVVITMVPDSPDVERVVLGENGVLSASRPGQIVIDMSTISPAVARKVYEESKGRGVSFLDAPVSGGDKGAIEGTLSIMVGGDKDAFKRSMDIFRAMGKNIVYMGPSGSGQSTKLCNQVVGVLNILAVCEGLMLGVKSGLDPDALISAISGGAAGSWMLSNLGPKMVKDDWRPGFKVALQQKDLRLALSAAESLELPLPGTALVHQLFRAVQAQGHDADGTQSLILALRALAGDLPQCSQ